jgi:hypothetical protein
VDDSLRLKFYHRASAESSLLYFSKVAFAPIPDVNIWHQMKMFEVEKPG